MVTYGYMENGYLNTREITDLDYIAIKEDGGEEKVKVTAEEQVANLNERWKPVQAIDEELMKCEEGYVIIPQPYDAGDTIAYRYNKVFDSQKVIRDIATLKEKLRESDYRVAKCYEASLLGGELPYVIADLHSERQALRDRINELEKKI